MLATAYVVSAVANLLLSVAVGRSLGAAALGTFALAVALGRIFYAGTDLGVATHLTRVLSRDRALSAQFTSLFVGFRARLIPVAMVLMAAVGATYGRDEAMLFGLVAIALGIVTLQGLYEAIFLVYEWQQAVVLLRVVAAILVAAGSAVWWTLGGTLVQLGLTYALMSVAGTYVWVHDARRRLGTSPRLAFDYRTLKVELSRSWPIGMSALLGIAALRCPVVVLGAFGSNADVGAFAAVDTFVTAVGISQVAITSATFPRLAATFRTDPPKFRRIFWSSNAVLAAIGVVGGVFFTFLGGEVISTVFPNKDFGQILGLAPVVGLSLPGLLLVHHNVYICAAADREMVNLRLMTAWLLIIGALQIWLVPVHGLMGAAWGLLIGRTVGLLALAGMMIALSIHRGGDVSLTSARVDSLPAHVPLDTSGLGPTPGRTPSR
jgi:O-antigen/teichoic acid export membrane protein